MTSTSPEVLPKYVLFLSHKLTGQERTVYE